MVIANVSTPSNFFHLIRRQLSRDFRTPLIVMAPKSLLRHPKCVSNLFEFYPGNHFKELIEDPILDPHLITEIIFCSGQIYYDLKLKQEQIQSKNKAIIRIEQLYPFPTKQIEKMLLKFPNTKTSWVQEEPLNMGAASFIKLHWNWNAIQIIARPASASTAVGFKKIHDRQLQDILETAFN